VVKQIQMRNIILFFSLISILTIACKESPNPKPEVYFRISFPEHEYQKYNCNDCPYTFDYPIYANITPANDADGGPCWININFRQYKAHFYLTLRDVENNLDSLLDDSHTLVYKHVIKADAITAQDFVNDSLKIYATMFIIDGNAASPLQFHITDSVRYFLRGSVYFDVPPNSDSLAPAIGFVTEDAMHLVESFEWKK